MKRVEKNYHFFLFLRTQQYYCASTRWEEAGTSIWENFFSTSNRAQWYALWEQPKPALNPNLSICVSLVCVYIYIIYIIFIIKFLNENFWSLYICYAIFILNSCFIKSMIFKNVIVLVLDFFFLKFLGKKRLAHDRSEPSIGPARWVNISW